MKKLKHYVVCLLSLLCELIIFVLGALTLFTIDISFGISTVTKSQKDLLWSYLSTCGKAQLIKAYFNGDLLYYLEFPNGRCNTILFKWDGTSIIKEG
jgi:hypothetical protein